MSFALLIIMRDFGNSCLITSPLLIKIFSLYTFIQNSKYARSWSIVGQLIQADFHCLRFIFSFTERESGFFLASFTLSLFINIVRFRRVTTPSKYIV
jgi:hypothetical protein